MGFYSDGLDNFGKFMYFSYVEIACRERVAVLSAMAPFYRIKSDMKFLPFPLYGYEAA